MTAVDKAGTELAPLVTVRPRSLAAASSIPIPVTNRRPSARSM